MNTISSEFSVKKNICQWKKNEDDQPVEGFHGDETPKIDIVPEQVNKTNQHKKLLKGCLK